MSDALGAGDVSAIGLLVGTPVFVAISLHLSVPALVGLTVAATAASLTAMAVTASRLLFDAATDAGLSPGVSSSLLLFTWPSAKAPEHRSEPRSQRAAAMRFPFSCWPCSAR
jgi:hypothetical protein